MQNLILATLAICAMITTTAQASVISEALDCKKRFDSPSLKANLDSMAKATTIDGQLVYNLKTPYKYGNAEISKFTLYEEVLEGHLKSNIGYKKAFGLLPPSNTLKQKKREATEQHMYWKGTIIKKMIGEARVQDSELDNTTIVACSWMPE